MWGLIAFVSFSLMGVFAINAVRRSQFELFRYVHALYHVGVITAMLHSDHVLVVSDAHVGACVG